MGKRVTKFEAAFLDAFSHAEPLLLGVALDIVKAHNRGDRETRNELVGNVKAVTDLRARCYSAPTRHHEMMTALNALLGTHGCEALGEVHMFDGPQWEYLNMGDAYTATLVWYRSSNRFYVRSYGDIVEAYRLK